MPMPHGNWPGPELHAGGDFGADERDLPEAVKQPHEEGPKYRNRDTNYSTPGARDWSDYPGGSVEFVDAGELFEFTDLLHQTNAKRAQHGFAKHEEKSMSPDEFKQALGQKLMAVAKRRREAATSPSRETTNIPATVLEEARIRLEHDADELSENGGELSNEDAGTLELLQQEEERRSIGASRRVQAAADDADDGDTNPFADEPDVADVDDAPVDDDGDDDVVLEAGEDLEDAENAAIERIEEVLEGFQEGVADLVDIFQDLQGIQIEEGQEADDGPDAAPADAGGGAFSGPSKELHNVPTAVLKDVAMRSRDDNTETVGDRGLVKRELDRRGLTAARDDTDDPFAGKTAPAWGDAFASALGVGPRPEPRPDFGEGRQVGAVKTAATEELPFNLFEQGSSGFHQAERSLAALAVNRRPEGRGRFAPPSPRLVNEAALVLRKAMRQLRGSYTIEDFDLEKVVSRKIAAIDGSILEGEFVWRVALADHSRGRRGSITLVAPIVGGSPVDGVAVLVDGGSRRIAFTRAALDEHLNIRRDRTCWTSRVPGADIALISE